MVEGCALLVRAPPWVPDQVRQVGWGKGVIDWPSPRPSPAGEGGWSPVGWVWGARCPAAPGQGGCDTHPDRGPSTYGFGSGVGGWTVLNPGEQAHVPNPQSTSPYPEPPSSANSFRSLYMP